MPAGSCLEPENIGGKLGVGATVGIVGVGVMGGVVGGVTGGVTGKLARETFIKLKGKMKGRITVINTVKEIKESRWVGVKLFFGL